MRALTIATISCLGFFAPALAQQNKSLWEQSFSEILRNYLFINDFYPKEETRHISDEVFWKYQLPLPQVNFDIHFALTDFAKEMPATPGVGREYEHLNRGRALYQEGKYEDARRVWLTGRQNFGKKFVYHRRTDYFIAQSMLMLAKQALELNGGDYNDTNVKTQLANAATFLSWAYVVKKDESDSLVEAVSPRNIYNLAAIYFRYGRFAGAFGAAQTGLDYLRTSGRNEYRPYFRRLIAEAHVQNSTYLEAVKELDTAIRQDPNPRQASIMFRRVGDIYYTLNNYELAEENYAIANRIDNEQGLISPAQHVLRGEALFWLGKFKDAQQEFRHGLESAGGKGTIRELDLRYQAVANLRLADIELATKSTERARLAYFRVGNEFRTEPEGAIARVRSACLELPEYDGNNVKHARELLSKAKHESYLPPQGQELAWACEVTSFTQRERTPEMIQRVREFAFQHPQSPFLSRLLDPVISMKQEQLDELFKSKQIYSALSFFEQTRAHLFPKVSPELSTRLFRAYVDTHQSQKAKEFWPSFAKISKRDDLDNLRMLAFLSEMNVATKKEKSWLTPYNMQVKKLANHRWTIAEEQLASNLVERIRYSGSTPTIAQWDYRLAKHWAGDNKQHICNRIYPLMSRLTTNAYRPQVKDDLNVYISKLLPELLSSDESCAISLLELELRLNQDHPQELASRYVLRSGWPMPRALATLYLEVAELNASNNKRDTAIQLWRHIKEKAPKGTPELELVNMRLDQSKTVYDGLWQQQ